MDFKWTAEESARYNRIYSQTKQWPAPGAGFSRHQSGNFALALGFLG
jgi:hypothetical protein